eukprot:CAMPEP_0180767514 /NCGR_PEP_ID=MMETSP1038_2-20121128/40064_1 /TAXON_ID=632150 /ORGANISM="Azadinium spinosum, Strain 3D9" /LENGTH=162 /DNA_ID=CAMNT_0022802087 /DNA_START=361 /DNA_END=849 /DNA_ORIENTATION=+
MTDTQKAPHRAAISPPKGPEVEDETQVIVHELVEATCLAYVATPLLDHDTKFSFVHEILRRKLMGILHKMDREPIWLLLSLRSMSWAAEAAVLAVVMLDAHAWLMIAPAAKITCEEVRGCLRISSRIGVLMDISEQPVTPGEASSPLPPRKTADEVRSASPR